MSNNTLRKTLFRTSMSGYKKEDVHAYIESENLRFVNIEREYTDRIKGLTDTINELNAKLASAEAAVIRLTEEVAAADALRNEIDALRAQIDEAKAQNAERDAEITDLRAKLEALAQEKADAVAALESENDKLREELSEQSAKTAEASSADDGYTLSDTEKKQISEMINRARMASEEILKRAEAGAEIIIDRARSEVYSYRLKTMSAAKEVFGIATDDLRRSISVCMNDFVASIKASKGDPTRSAEAASDCDDDLSRRIERMQNDLDRAIAEKLAEFDGNK